MFRVDSSSVPVHSHATQNHIHTQGLLVVNTLEELRTTLCQIKMIDDVGNVVKCPAVIFNLTEEGNTRFKEFMERLFIVKKKNGEEICKVSLGALFSQILEKASQMGAPLSRLILSHEAALHVYGVESFTHFFLMHGIVLSQNLQQEIAGRCEHYSCATIILEDSTVRRNAITLGENILHAALCPTREAYEFHKEGFLYEPQRKKERLVMAVSDRVGLNVAFHFSPNAQSGDLLTRERVPFPFYSNQHHHLHVDPRTLLQGLFDWLFKTSRVQDFQAIDHLSYLKLLSSQLVGESIDGDVLRACLAKSAETARDGLKKSVWSLLQEIWVKDHFRRGNALPLLFLNAYPLLKQHLNQADLAWIMEEIRKQKEVPTLGILGTVIPLLSSQSLTFDVFFTLYDQLNKLKPCPQHFERYVWVREASTREAFVQLLSSENAVESFKKVIECLFGNEWGLDDFLLEASIQNKCVAQWLARKKGNIEPSSLPRVIQSDAACIPRLIQQHPGQIFQLLYAKCAELTYDHFLLLVNEYSPHLLSREEDVTATILRYLEEGKRPTPTQLKAYLSQASFASAAKVLRSMRQKGVTQLNTWAVQLVIRKNDKAALLEKWEFWKEFHSPGMTLSRHSITFLLDVLDQLETCFIHSVVNDLSQYRRQDQQIERKFNDLLLKKLKTSSLEDFNGFLSLLPPQDTLQVYLLQLKERFKKKEYSEAFALLGSLPPIESQKEAISRALQEEIAALKAIDDSAALRTRMLFLTDPRALRFLAADQVGKEKAQLFKQASDCFLERPLYKSLVIEFLTQILPTGCSSDELVATLTRLMPYRSDMPTTCKNALQTHGMSLVRSCVGLQRATLVSRLHFFDASPSDVDQMYSVVTEGLNDVKGNEKVDFSEVDCCLKRLCRGRTLGQTDAIRYLKWLIILLQQEPHCDLREWLQNLQHITWDEETKFLLRHLGRVCLEKKGASTEALFELLKDQIDPSTFMAEIIESEEVSDRVALLARYYDMKHAQPEEKTCEDREKVERLVCELPVGAGYRIVRQMREQAVLSNSHLTERRATSGLTRLNMIESWNFWKEFKELGGELDPEERAFVLRMLGLLGEQFVLSIAQEIILFRGQDGALDRAIGEMIPLLFQHDVQSYGLTKALKREIYSLLAPTAKFNLIFKMARESFERGQYQEGLIALNNLTCDEKQIDEVREWLQKVFVEVSQTPQGLASARQILQNNGVKVILGEAIHQQVLSSCFHAVAVLLASEPSTYRSLAFDYLPLVISVAHLSSDFEYVLQSLRQFKSEMPTSLKTTLRQSECAIYRSREGIDRLRLANQLHYYDFSPTHPQDVLNLLNEAWDHVIEHLSDPSKVLEVHQWLLHLGNGGRLQLKCADSVRTLRVLKWIHLLVRLGLFAQVDGLIPKLKNAAWNEESKKILLEIVDMLVVRSSFSTAILIVDLCKEQCDTESLIPCLVDVRASLPQKLKIFELLQFSRSKNPKTWEQVLLSSNPENIPQVQEAVGQLLVKKVEPEALLSEHPEIRARIWGVALESRSHHFLECLEAVPPFETFMDEENQTRAYERLLSSVLVQPKPTLLNKIMQLRQKATRISFENQVVYLRYLLSIRTATSHLLALDEFLINGYSPEMKTCLNEWIIVFHEIPNIMEKIAEHSRTYCAKVVQLIDHAKRHGFSELTPARLLSFYAAHTLPVFHKLGLDILSEDPSIFSQEHSLPSIQQLYDQIASHFDSVNVQRVFNLKDETHAVSSLFMSKLLQYALRTEKKEELIFILRLVLEHFESLDCEDCGSEKRIVSLFQDALVRLAAKYNERTTFFRLLFSLSMATFKKACQRSPSRSISLERARAMCRDAEAKYAQKANDFFLMQLDNNDEEEQIRHANYAIDFFSKLLDYPADTEEAREFISSSASTLIALVESFSKKPTIYQNCQESMVNLIDKYVELREPDDTPAYQNHHNRLSEVAHRTLPVFVRKPEDCNNTYCRWHIKSTLTPLFFRTADISTPRYYAIDMQMAMIENLAIDWLKQRKLPLFIQTIALLQANQLQSYSLSRPKIIQRIYLKLFEELPSYALNIHCDLPVYQILCGTLNNYLTVPGDNVERSKIVVTLCTSFFRVLFSLRTAQTSREIESFLIQFLRNASELKAFETHYLLYLECVERLIAMPFNPEIFKTLRELLVSYSPARYLEQSEKLKRANLLADLIVKAASQPDCSTFINAFDPAGLTNYAALHDFKVQIKRASEAFKNAKRSSPSRPY